MTEAWRKKFIEMDRSKYKNPDMPVGYVKKKQELNYKEGVEIDGEHLVWTPWLYDLHLNEREDYATLGELIFMTDEEDNLEETEADFTKSPVNIELEAEESVTKNASASEKENPAEKRATKKKNSEPEKKENPAEKSVAKKKNSELEKKENLAEIVIKTEKKDYVEVDSSLDTSTSCLDTDTETKEKRKKDKKIKKERKTDHSDSSSPPPRRHRHKKSIVTYSPSPSPERFTEKQIKEEFSDDQPQHLFGSYYCDVCNITMNSLLTYETHVNGKKHRKNMKARNVSEIAAHSVPATVISEDQSKYPQPRPGIIRRKVHSSSKIQHIIERDVKVPCPGLDQIIEIQGIEGVQYFCSMCNSNCSSNSIIPHITGYKHQLRSVKYFKPSAYDYMSNEPKFKIEKDLISLLRSVEKKEGMGKMAVEIEELSSISQDKGSRSRSSSSSRDHRSQPSTSKVTSIEHTSKSISERHRTAVIPSQSASDFFCEICQSHMNALAMWEAHIRGKRHLTNLKKMPGDLPSKTKTILLPNKRAYILDRLRDECPDEPVVGLKEVRETEIPETKSHSYQCFLCGSCHTSLDIVEHLISLKHRCKYLEHIDYPGREVYFGMSDIAAESLVKEMCAIVEATEGPGKPAVHISKSAIYR